MYGLKQAGLLAYNQLVKNFLTRMVITQSRTPLAYKNMTNHQHASLWLPAILELSTKEESRYRSYLISCASTMSVILVDLTGLQYCSLALNWNYDQRIVNMSMPGCVKKAMEKYQYQPTKKRGAPHQWTTQVYRANIQYAKEEPDEMLFGQAWDEVNPVGRRSFPLLWPSSQL